MTRITFAVAVGLLAAGTATLVHAGAARDGEPTPAREGVASINEQIVGTWRLDSIYEEDAGGEDIAQFGPDPKGVFMADRQGNFSFQVMSIDGRRYAAKGGLPGGMTGGAGMLEAMTFFGTYAVDKQDRKLTLHVTYCLFRSCDQTDRTAELKFRGDTMVFISAAEFSPTGAAYSRIVWKRECCK